MSVQRLDNALIVVEDIDGVIAFFVELGLELEGRGPLTGRWAERVIGLEDVEQEFAMLRVPGGGAGVELARFTRPAPIRPTPARPPANTLGLRRVMFAVDDVDATVARLQAIGAALVGEIVDYEDVYRLCYVRGPEEIVVGLAQELQE